MKSKTPARPIANSNRRSSRLPTLALVLGVCSILVIHVDTTVIAFADSTKLRGDVGRMVDLSEAFAFGPAAVVIALGVFLCDQRNKWYTARLFAYPIVAGVLANVAKLAIPRLRPRGLAELTDFRGAMPSGWDTFALSNSDDTFRSLGDGSSSAWQSFPSGHAATAIGLAIGLSRLYPNARWYFFGLALFAGLQRIFSNAHYPSDILAGGAVAMFTCWVLERKSAFSLAIPADSNVDTPASLIRLPRAA